jgi:hypothetical protein
MTDDTTTVDEAKRCPKCQHPGKQVASRYTVNAKRARVSVLTFECETEVCPWFETTWIVQVNPDGTVPVNAPGPKSFPDVSPDTISRGAVLLDSIKQEEARGE